jgi:uncharacterized protein YcsI (UPF0317 family)
VQAGLAIVPSMHAFDFLRFCALNPRPCPIVDITEIGDPEPRRAAPGADVRTDLPGYRVYRDGVLAEERSEVRGLWSSDSVAFLIGCSFTFEGILERAGVFLPGRGVGRGNAIFRTNRACVSSGPFRSELVVSMRPIRDERVALASELTSRVPLAHGRPIHVGDPTALGIADLSRPHWGSPHPTIPGTTPVFWACSLTAELAGAAARLPIFITHAAAHMLVTDLRVADL